MVKFPNPKNFNASVKFLVTFFLTLLIFFFLPDLIGGYFQVLVNVSEVPWGINQSFSFRTGTLVELILLGPAFAIVVYILMSYLLKPVQIQEDKKIYAFIIEIATVLFICIYVMGQVFHKMFNYADEIYTNIYALGSLHYLLIIILLLPEQSLQVVLQFLSPLFLYIYYSDEWIGHHLIHISYFAFIVLALITEILRPEHLPLNKFELVITIFTGVGASIVNGYATYEGQCAFPLFLMSLILFVLELIYIFNKKINIKEYPVLFATLICNIIVISIFLYWILAFGLKPYYPFIYQPSEL